MQNPTPGGPLPPGTPLRPTLQRIPAPLTPWGVLCSPHSWASPAPEPTHPLTLRGVSCSPHPLLLRVSPAPGPHTPGHPRPSFLALQGRRPERTTARPVRGGSPSAPLSLPPPASPRKEEVAAPRRPYPPAGGRMRASCPRAAPSPSARRGGRAVLGRTRHPDPAALPPHLRRVLVSPTRSSAEWGGSVLPTAAMLGEGRAC